MKAKKRAPKAKRSIIRVDSIKSEEHDDKKEVIISNDDKDLESSKDSRLDDSQVENDEMSDHDYAEESERIARALSHKIVNYINNPTEADDQEKNEIDQSNLNVSDENCENSKNSDLELKTVNRSIVDVMKDQHFYKEENSCEIKPDKRKKIYKKKSVLEISILTGFNSIKYRLKKNYFGGAQT